MNKINCGGPTHSGSTLRYSVAPSIVGPMLLVASSTGIAALAFLQEKSEADALADLRLNLGNATLERDKAALEKYAALASHFLQAGDRARQTVPLDLRGTKFQMSVWKELMHMTGGSTATYSDIARRIGRPKAVRAVATAIGDNPVSLFVPCHRILRKDGSLGGYRWGLDVKSRLLEIERSWRIPTLRAAA